MRGALLGIATAAAVALSCNSAPPSAPVTPAVTHALTSAQVVQVFLAWVCPGNPVIAGSLYKPVASAISGEPGVWQLATDGGKFTLRETTKEVVPSGEVETSGVNVMRSDERCRARPAN